MPLPSVLQDLLTLFFPKVCPGCGKGLLKNEHLICTNCIISLEEIQVSFGPNHPAMKIFEGRLNLQNAGALYYYARDTAIQKIVHQIKYNGRKDLALWLGERMAEKIISSGCTDIDLLVPIPLSDARMKERGFNQSEMLARGIKSKVNISIDKNLIGRRNKTESQTHKNRIERWENVMNDFVLLEPNLEGKHILLIDDVITTGATLEACANQLHKLNNCRISCYALCLAS